MEIGAVKIVDPVASYPTLQKNESVAGVKVENTSHTDKNITTDSSKGNNKASDDSRNKKDLNKEQLTKVNEELNHFLSLIDSNIQFSIHEKSKQLMVQVIDTKDKRVLKEFPSHEMLNIMANIREYVGVLLDKRA